MENVSSHQNERPADEPITHRIVTAVAAREGVDPTDLPPLASVVDADALKSLATGHANCSGRISFSYLDYEVTVVRNGSVSVSVDPACDRNPPRSPHSPS